MMTGMHKRIDPHTGGCLDCGATRKQFDDNRMLDHCPGFPAPNRIIGITAQRELWQREDALARMRDLLRVREEGIVTLSREIRERDSECRELAEQVERLRQG